MFPANFPLWQEILIYALSVWSYIWKGIALWRAVKNNQRNWFIALLILNTVGILDIIYLFQFAKKKMTFEDVGKFFQHIFSPKNKKES